MAILSTEENRIQYVSNGTVGPYTFPYLFLDAADLHVVVTEIATNIDTAKALGVDYTVAGAGLESGGSITWVGGLQPAATLYRITITREVDYKQETDYTEGDNFPADTHENALTKITMQTQQLRSLVGRAVSVPDTDVLDLPLLPAASARANKFLAFDALGNPVASTSGPGSTPISTFMSTVVSATDAIVARGSLNAIGRVTNIAALKALAKTSLVNGDVVLVEGYYAAGDAGGGHWFWDASSAVADNGGTFIQSDAGGVGRWRLIHNGMVTVLQFGAKGDNTTNDQPSIQNAITFCAANNQHLHMPGWLTSGVEATWKCTSQLLVPSNRAFRWTMTGGHLSFVGLGANSGIIFDSCMMTEIELLGEVIYDGTNYAIEFHPTTNVPVDAFKVVIDSRFYFTAVVNTNITSSNGNILMNPDTGTISNSSFWFAELNGEGAPSGGGITQFGIVVSTPGVSTAFSDNFIWCPHIHNHAAASVQLGTVTTRASQIARCKWDICCYPNNTKGGLDCFGIGHYGTVNVLPSTGTPGTGIKFQTSADQNFFISTNLSTTTTINDSSTTKTNYVLYKAARTRNTIAVGASPFVYQAVAARCEKVTIFSGTVSNIEYSIDGTNWDSIGSATGRDVDLWPGDRVRVTYTVAPTMRTYLDGA